MIEHLSYHLQAGVSFIFLYLHIENYFYDYEYDFFVHFWWSKLCARSDRN